jgi:Chromate transporter.
MTFGGAYAVLAYINQAAVAQYGWLLPTQMVAGLGLAETSPRACAPSASSHAPAFAVFPRTCR